MTRFAHSESVLPSEGWSGSRIWVFFAFGFVWCIGGDLELSIVVDFGCSVNNVVQGFKSAFFRRGAGVFVVICLSIYLNLRSVLFLFCSSFS